MEETRLCFQTIFIRGRRSFFCLNEGDERETVDGQPGSPIFFVSVKNSFKKL